MQRDIAFLGSSLEDLRRMPQGIRRAAGYQLNKLQDGERPDDWKPMSDIGSGAAEIRIRDSSGAYRVVYVAKFVEAIYVLHVFTKKSQRTAPTDIELARARYRQLLRSRP